ncbi:MAG: hypothetical protein U0354_04015 [Candidatus Sericytochromatia bacterium]
MFKKLLSLLLCLITILFINNPAMAIERNQTIIDSYKPELTSFINVSSESSEPIYLARERRAKDSGTGEMSWAWIGSIFVTGLGQILLGEVLRGLAFLGVVILGVIVIGFTMGSTGAVIAPLYALVFQIWSIFDAYGIAKRQAEGDEEARLLNEKLAQIEKVLNRISIENNKLSYSLANF